MNGARALPGWRPVAFADQATTAAVTRHLRVDAACGVVISAACLGATWPGTTEEISPWLGLLCGPVAVVLLSGAFLLRPWDRCRRTVSRATAGRIALLGPIDDPGARRFVRHRLLGWIVACVGVSLIPPSAVTAAFVVSVPLAVLSVLTVGQCGRLRRRGRREP